MERPDFWGYHLQIDAAGFDNPQHPFPPLGISNCFSAIFQEMGQEGFGEMHSVGAVHFQISEVAGIVMHLADEHRELYVDVFSKEPFDRRAVIACIQGYLGIGNHAIRSLRRSAPRTS